MSITEEQNQEHTRLAAINEVVKTIASSLDLRQVYDAFASQLRRLIAFDRAGVNLIEGDKVKVFASSVDEKAEFASGIAMPLKDTAVEWIAANKKVYIATDLAEERKYWTDDTLFREGMRSVIRIPLLSGGEVIGTFSIASRQPNAFGKKEQQILEEIAPLLAVAIENGRLFEQTRARAEELKASEEEYRRLAEDINDGYLVVTSEGKIVFANAKLAEISGYKLKELIGEHIRKLVPQESIPYTGETQQRVKQRRRVRERLEGPLLNKDGELVPIEMSIKVIEYGVEPALAVIVRDITARKRAEEALQKVTGEQAVLLGTVPAMIFWIDKEGKFIRANEAFAAALHKSPDDINGKSLFDLYPEDMAKSYYNDNVQVMESGVPKRRIEEPVKTPAGIMWVSTDKIPYRDESGSIVGIIGFSVDITERKRAEEESKSYTKRVEALHAVAQTVSQTLNMEQMVDSALDKVLEVMDLDGGVIYFIDTEAREIVLKAHRGVSEEFVSVMGRIKVTEADIQRWLEQREPAFGLESMLDRSTLAEVEATIKTEGMQSYVGTPLQSKDLLHGVIVLGDRSKRWFSSEELDLLQAIGNEIAVGIENAQLLEKTRGLSITDELTGLYNRRHFYEMLETEMYRTQRYGRPFSLAMLDLDGFKEYNDKFGHTNGDALLQAVAQTLMSAVRKTDTAFRYGGDEFAIILPATDADRARKIVDRIRSKWSEVPKPENLVLKTPLGLSAGIAQFPENAETADGLVFLTDTALGCSKMEGGDKTTLVSDLGALTSDVLSRSTLEQVYALSATVDARDPFTYGHSKRVAAISEMIGKAIGLSRDKLANLHAASLLHDIGKVGVSDSILTKPGKPTKAEWKLIKKHSAEGARIVGYFKELAALVPTIRHHHEWYGGMGYPDGLKGEDIPLGARIISIADAYDTMTTPRTYRDVVSQQEACEELRRCSGTQFDPELVEAFCQATNEATRQD